MHTCGYRVVQGRADANSVFRDSGPNLDSWREDDTCSYCGSLNPDILMARMEAGDIEIGPTDKSYKVYVKNLGGAELKAIKFYFYHFTPEQQAWFIDMLNQRRIHFSYPGHLYTLPYFCERSKA